MLFHGSRLHVRPGAEALFKVEGLHTPEAVIAKWVTAAPDPRRRTRVAEFRTAQGHFFIKTYDYAGAARLRTLLVPARVRREFENLEGLARLGMPVPEPVAWGQTRSMGLVTSSFVITRAVEHAIDLRDLADRKPAPFPLPARKERNDLIKTFARRLRRCHDEGWFIHTLFFKNLLLTKGVGGYELHLIDVPFAHIWRNRLRPEAGRLRDFACLLKGAVTLLTKTERMRFYRAYSGEEGRLRADERAFLRRAVRSALRS
jgi:hypothetical protein